MSWLFALFLKIRDRHDPAVRVTGYAYTQGEKYDESKAVQAAKRAAELEERHRTLALERAGTAKSPIVTPESEQKPTPTEFEKRRAELRKAACE